MPSSSAPALRAWPPAAFAPQALAGDAEPPARDAAEAGYAAGHAAGLAAARGEAARLAALFAATERSLALFEERIAGALLDLAVDIARQVIRAELASQREALLPVAREAAALLAQEARAVEIHVHPADAELLRTHLGADIERGGWRLVEDPRLEPGGLRIASSTSEVDATVATRWRRVLAAIGQDHAWRDEPA